MKYISLIVLILGLSSCKHYSYVEFDGTAAGVKSGVFVIKDNNGNEVFGENITDGKFHMDKKGLEAPGYYTMSILDDAHKDAQPPAFEIYLEDGKYSIGTQVDERNKYPVVTSTSATQQQLSEYYTLADKVAGDLGKQLAEATAKANDKRSALLSSQAYNNLLDQISDLDAKKRESISGALDQFVAKNPQNTIGAHVMLRLSYENDPLFYNNIFKKLTADVRNSDEGKQIGEKLSHLVKLVPGAQAPPIAGKLIDGSNFDYKKLGKKIYLVDFWRAANDFSRTNHEKLKEIITQIGTKDFGVISVSMDVRANWWSTAVKDDHLTWTQVSDLKGDYSPNAANWSISRIPTYYLVDSNWNIVERDLQFTGIALAVEDYLKKHH